MLADLGRIWDNVGRYFFTVFNQKNSIRPTVNWPQTSWSRPGRDLAPKKVQEPIVIHLGTVVGRFCKDFECLTDVWCCVSFLWRRLNINYLPYTDTQTHRHTDTRTHTHTHSHTHTHTNFYHVWYYLYWAITSDQHHRALPQRPGGMREAIE